MGAYASRAINDKRSPGRADFSLPGLFQHPASVAKSVRNYSDVSNVAHALSNVKDAAAGKSFIFITIVMRNAIGTLMRAVFALLRTPVIGLVRARSHDCERGTHECVRHKCIRDRTCECDY